MTLQKAKLIELLYFVWQGTLHGSSGPVSTLPFYGPNVLHVGIAVYSFQFFCNLKGP